jgi:F-type H+-transporting ATPase subunit epsilon
VADGRLTLTVVTPERAVVNAVACDAVSLPGHAGELGVLPGHTPLVTLLGVGTVSWSDGALKDSVAVRGGFAEIADDVVRVLADFAVPADEVDRDAARAGRGAAEARLQTVVGLEQLDEVNGEIAYAEAQLAITGGKP